MKKQSYWTAELLPTPVLLAGMLMLGSNANYMSILAGKIVDHTTMEYLHNFQDRAIEAGHTCVLVGMEQFRGLSDHNLAYRVKARENAIAFA